MFPIKPINILLSKVTNGSAIRTNNVKGFCLKLPHVGECFRMFGPSLTPEGEVRTVSTSTVKEVANEDGYLIIKTENSVYKLELLQ